jgi:hypothetical protein
VSKTKSKLNQLQRSKSIRPTKSITIPVSIKYTSETEVVRYRILTSSVDDNDNDDNLLMTTATKANTEAMLAGTGDAVFLGMCVDNHDAMNATPQRLSTLKHWIKFVDAHTSLPPDAKPNFLIEGHTDKVDWGLLKDFLAFAVRSNELKGKPLLKGAWDTLLNSTQDWILRDLASAGHLTPRGLVHSNGTIKKMSKGIGKGNSKVKEENNSDL